MNAEKDSGKFLYKAALGAETMQTAKCFMKRGFWVVGLIGLLACGDPETPGTPEIPDTPEIPAPPKTPGACTLNSECPKGSFCQTQIGEEGLCVLGSVDAHGNPVPTVISWKVSQGGLKKLAVEWEAVDSEEERFLSEEERVGAPGWLNGKGFEIEAEVVGAGAGEGFEAWAIEPTRGGRVEGDCTVEALSPERAKWTCHMPNGYIGQWREEAFEVYIQAGRNPQIPGAREGARKRSYNADSMPPIDFRLRVTNTATPGERLHLGDTISICSDGATENGSGLHSMDIVVAPRTIYSQLPLPMENVTRNGSCTDIYLPLDLDMGGYEADSLGMLAGVTAYDNVGNSNAYAVTWYQFFFEK
ncbi:MAG: hypothetical protein FWC28_00215 [Proteobacteria bacterium]|nr:hypothetical protein [Pseudomonadota bacterium]